MINMRVSKDRDCPCNSCGKNAEESVEMFDMKVQIPKQNAIILHFCDKCISEMFDKTLKARCLVDAMVKTPKQMHIINGRRRVEMIKREKERNGKKII